MKVLLIQNETEIQEMISEILVNKGFEVETVNDGDAGISKLTGGSFDLVIADVQLPKTGGIQILNWARANIPKLKVILIADGTDPQKLRVLNDLRSNGIILKPLKLDEVLKQVQSAVSDLSEPAKDDIISADASGFARVPIDDFLVGKKVPYSIHIRIDATK
ncbi:MAG: response regulator, partial [Bdellovibrionota bacterium]